MAESAKSSRTPGPVIFHITADPPHKEQLVAKSDWGPSPPNDFPSIELLKRAHCLKGHHRLFTRGDPFYRDKAKNYPNRPFLMGADAVVQMLDPKWGVDLFVLFEEFEQQGTRFLVVGRFINGVWTTLDDLKRTLFPSLIRNRYHHLFTSVEGRWDISSTELREKKS
jgi:hypothetical protein